MKLLRPLQARDTREVPEVRNASATLHRLVRSTDDVLRFCIDARAHATRPWVRHALDRITETHWHIANELCTHIAVGGSRLTRVGRWRRSWHTAWCHWLARNHFDNDLAYVRQVQRREGALAHRFTRALRGWPAGESRRCLEKYAYEIDRLQTQMACVDGLVCAAIDAKGLESRVRPGAPRPPRNSGRQRTSSPGITASIRR